MIKKLLFFATLALLITTFSAQAAPVDASKAARVAANYAKATGMKINMAQGHLSDISASVPFSEFYVFIGTDGNGFVLVSADDCVVPILASSDQSVFNSEAMPDNIMEWLLGYEQQISYCRDNGIAPTPQIARQWVTLTSDSPDPSLLTTTTTSVSPLLTTTWNQSPYYNNLCPGPSSNKAVTGCAATAAAQVMKYWNHPSEGYGSHSYVSDNYGLLSADFENTTYDWDNMPDALTSSSTTTQVTAVATLMYHLGVAMDMDYSSGGSGAYVSKTKAAFSTYFKYMNTIRTVSENNYTNADWKALLRNELDATPARPILYTGQGDGGGHAFVFDGYNTTDHFHVNWGWGGYCDGYYAIGALNPSTGGIGGNSNGQYNSSCQAIIGIEPDTNFNVGESTIVNVFPDDTLHGVVGGGGTYANFSSVTVTATANPGYRFVRWNDGLVTNPRTFTVTGGVVSLTAIYENLSGNTKHYSNRTMAPNSYSYYFLTNWGMIINKEDLHDVKYLQSVTFYPYEAGEYELRIYHGSYATIAATGRCNITSSQTRTWQTVYLDTPLEVDTSNSMYVSFYTEDTTKVLYNRYAWSGNTDGQVKITQHEFFGLSFYSRTNFSSKGDFYIEANFVNEYIAPVSNLQVSNVTSTSATLNWDISADATPVNYTVFYGTTDNLASMDSIVVATTTAQLSSLTHFSDYYAYVRANYASGLSGFTSATFRTPIQPSTDDSITLVVNVSGNQGGIALGSGTYLNGTLVDLIAIPEPGYRFVRWIDGSTDSVHTVSAIANITYVAYFERQYYGIYVTFEGCSGTLNYSGGSYSTNSDGKYGWGSTLALHPTPKNANYHFSHWDDGVTTNPRWVTVVSDIHLTAVFEQNSAKTKCDILSDDRVIVVRTTDPTPISIYDAMGRLFYSTGATTQTETRVPVAHAGVYLVRVDNNTTQKIVVR